MFHHIIYTVHIHPKTPISQLHETLKNFIDLLSMQSIRIQIFEIYISLQDSYSEALSIHAFKHQSRPLQDGLIYIGSPTNSSVYIHVQVYATPRLK